MMTDRELLEAAYKAAFGGAMLSDDKDMQKRWNPLANDGDAFQLLVKLNLIFPLTRLQHFLTLERFSRQGDNDDVATRRAIVRTAAERGLANEKGL
jgi:transcriptional regulator of met regulon